MFEADTPDTDEDIDEWLERIKENKEKQKKAEKKAAEEKLNRTENRRTYLQMSGIDGMETARELRKKDKNVILIFVTAVEEYVFQAFDVQAFHYIVKPIDHEKKGGDRRKEEK